MTETETLRDPASERTSISTESEGPGLVAGAAAGVASAAFGLGVAEIIAGISQSFTSPVIAVGDRVVDNVPSALKDIAIQLFGTNDKIALLAGIASVLVLYSAVLGVIALRKSLQLALVGVAIFGIVGSLAAYANRSGSSITGILPTVIGTIVTGAVLVALTRLAHAENDASTQAGTDSAPSRRSFLTAVGALLVGGGITGYIGQILADRFDVDGQIADLTLPEPVEVLAAVPDAAQAENAASFITSNDDFYRIDTALSVPQVDADSWSLRIHGMVDNEITLSYQDLLDREIIERDITLTCVSNTIGGELIGTARWLGTRLDDLLNEAGINPEATQIVGRSTDGYTCGFPVSTLDGRDALVAIAMNGEPLPAEHGFPARLITPGLYGYVSATKWLTEIELTTFEDFDQYWVPRGYAEEAPIKLMSRIDAPRGLDQIPPGPFVIAGVAWAQTIGIDAVEISIDDGEWIQADLADEVNDITWRQWSHPWEATEGRHTIAVRATDRNNSIQTDERSEPLPNGASGHHTVVVLVQEA